MINADIINPLLLFCPFYDIRNEEIHRRAQLQIQQKISPLLPFRGSQREFVKGPNIATHFKGGEETFLQIAPFLSKHYKHKGQFCSLKNKKIAHWQSRKLKQNSTILDSIFNLGYHGNLWKGY